MKYMGSKRSMLGNGLGELLLTTVPNKRRFVDLFCGSAAVASHVARNIEIETLAFDLQYYAVALAQSTLGKTVCVRPDRVWKNWLSRVNYFIADDVYSEATRLSEIALLERYENAVAGVEYAREFCRALSPQFPIARAYGGYYFSPKQAIFIDAFRATVPSKNARAPGLAALIRAASRCSASPGHTAQPFSPTVTALPHLQDAWKKDVIECVQAAFLHTCSSVALRLGKAEVSDAVEATLSLRDDDIVFIDPPYSEVQYSRFYHVLESIAVGRVGEVSGIGRYPAIGLRPQSRFCKVTESIDELDRLMISVASSGAEAIVTFPADQASNGLSGEVVEAISGQYFRIQRRKISSSFSTLGGNTRSRAARKQSTELLLHLTPR